MVHDLKTIRDNAAAGASGIMRVMGAILLDEPDNKDTVALNRAMMALHEAVVNLDHFIKDTPTGRRVKGV